MAYDTIIIGAGLSGLTCGLLLAKTGRKVLIVEQHTEPAPVVRGFSRKGIYFDSGFHYVGGMGEGGPLGHLMEYLGLTDKLQLYPFADEGFDCLRIKGERNDILLPAGLDRIKDHLSDRFPAFKGDIEVFLQEVGQRWCDFPYLDLDKEFSAGDLQSVHEQSLAQRLEVFSAAPQLQSLLSMHSLLYGVNPKDASVTLNAQVAGSYFHSVHGVVGGGRGLVEAYLQRLAQAGTILRCRAEVSQVLVADGRVAGVALNNGETIRAPEVVATCNPALVPLLVPAGVLRPAYSKRLSALRQTPSALILYGRCKEPTPFLYRKNLFFYPQAGTLQDKLDQPLEERPMYLAGADYCEEVHGVRGVIAIVPASMAEVAPWNNESQRRCRDYLEWKGQMTVRLTRHLMIVAPELGELEPLDLATPLTLQDYSRAPQGAIYGVGRFLGQYNPQPQTRLPGLYLSGQAVAGPGLLGAMVAGYYTCGTMTDHEFLRGELRACR